MSLGLAGVPTDDEWTVMTDYLDGIAVAGGQMEIYLRLDRQWKRYKFDGFSGLMGVNLQHGILYRSWNQRFLWSSSPSQWIQAWARGLANYSDEIYPGCLFFKVGIPFAVFKTID